MLFFFQVGNLVHLSSFFEGWTIKWEKSLTFLICGFSFLFSKRRYPTANQFLNVLSYSEAKFVLIWSSNNLNRKLSFLPLFTRINNKKYEHIFLTWMPSGKPFLSSPSGIWVTGSWRTLKIAQYAKLYGRQNGSLWYGAVLGYDGNRSTPLSPSFACTYNIFLSTRAHKLRRNKNWQNILPRFDYEDFLFPTQPKMNSDMEDEDQSV